MIENEIIMQLIDLDLLEPKVKKKVLAFYNHFVSLQMDLFEQNKEVIIKEFSKGFNERIEPEKKKGNEIFG